MLVFLSRQFTGCLSELAIMSVYLLMSNAAQAQHPQTAITASVAHFRGDRPGAVSYTFDDGIEDQAELAWPMLRNRGFHGTFFIIASVVPNTDAGALTRKPGGAGGITWKKLSEMQADGNEIASHSWSHPNLPNLNDEQLRREIYQADTCIFNHLGTRPVTFAYPYNAFDERVRNAVMKDHIASRDYQQAFGNPRFTLAFANSWAKKQIDMHTWGVALIHGISDGFDAFTSPEILSSHFDFVKQHENELWIDTFAHIAIYQAERDRTVVFVREKSHGQVICQLSNKLDPLIYNQPVTVVLHIPGVKSANAEILGKTTPVKVGEDRVIFDCVPNTGPVSVTWK